MARKAKAAPRIYVLAGVNGAGKSSIGGAMLRAAGANYFNPDEAAAALIAANPGLDQTKANAAAWRQGKRLLEKAIRERLDFAFETTLGGSTMARLLAEAASQGFEVRIWYVGLASPEEHIARVAQRVSRGGHDIPETTIRRRWRHSRQNLIQLLPALTELRVYDNSADADPAEGARPKPTLVLHLAGGDIAGPADLSATPQWAKPIVAAALKMS
ncbi:zeta toxin family protein [Mycolicibacterium sp. 120270]|jgi:predicted ABC-type ATPase|uniref:zeta toxin family protein n=1 Tax=Mycolicibacterium sp. 120270 TaxID=3090600 RepID=UPI00299E4E66|nr:zeta toxin family protein [Mycolicibacterium sp. 120270]MDX1886371.1 zeta toxin family protein [Mycolicibacterium sp. 120270]